MTFDGSVSIVTKALKGLNGVSDVDVDLESQSATVRIAGNDAAARSAGTIAEKPEK